MSSRVIDTASADDHMKETAGHKESRCDMEAIFNTLINAQRRHGGAQERTVMDWAGQRGKFSARRIAGQTYLVQYSVDDASDRKYLFEVNLIA